MMKRLCVGLIFLAVVITGCGGGDEGGGGSYSVNEPSTVSTFSADQILDYYNNPTTYLFPGTGICRYPDSNLPIPIYTGGNLEAREAIAHFEGATGGLVSFVEVANREDVQNGYGFIIEEGGATNGDGSPGCGSATNMVGGEITSGCVNGELSGYYIVNLGSAACNDASAGWYPSAVAEHEIGHLLVYAGMHTTNFTGDEGLSGELLSLIMTNYSNAPGTPTTDLVPVVKPGM